MIRSFHLRLIVADFDGCFRFYRDVLGLRVTWGEETDGSASGYASFELPDGSLSINDQNIFAPVVGFETREPGETAKDRAALIFEVESVDLETERLRALGAAFETEPTTYRGWGIRAAHLRDPDGNLIESTSYSRRRSGRKICGRNRTATGAPESQGVMPLLS